MTGQDLKDKGWVAEQCKIGILYFKDVYFCRLTEEGEAIVFVTFNDMVPLGTAKTYEEIIALQKSHEIKEIEKFESYVDYLKKSAIEKYGNLDV